MKKILLLASLFLLAATTAHAATVMPHRAIYDLTLMRSGEGSALQSAEGRLAFERMERELPHGDEIPARRGAVDAD